MAAVLADLEAKLREELGARPLASAHLCPSWGAYVSALRSASAERADSPEAAIADALELALHSPREHDHDTRLRAATRQALQRVGGREWMQLRELWEGRDQPGWSLWFGPFVLAWIDPPDASEASGILQVRERLGPLARLLLPARCVDQELATDWLLELDDPIRHALPLACPGARAPLTALLRAANRALHGEQALDAQALERRWEHDFISYWRDPDPAPGCAAVVELDGHERARNLHPEAIESLVSVIYVGAPELLVPRLPLSSRRAWPAPAHDFEARREQLVARQPGLFATLARELASRTLAQAPACPSWIVLLDFLLSEGEELLAEWLRAALDDPEREAELGAELLRGPFSHPRKHRRYELHKLWKQPPDSRRAHWFGPFVLRYFDPFLREGLGADALQSMLGVHASLLGRAQVYTQIDEPWIDEVLRPREAPLLAPTPAPAAALEIAAALSLRIEAGDHITGTLRIAAPGEVLEPRPERVVWTNIGPVAGDYEATAVLVCESEADLERHAAPREHLDSFAHVIVLGTHELLARWPHAHVRMREWGAGLGSA